METISKRLDSTKAEVVITLNAEEVNEHIAAVYKEAGKVRIPGFRQGKAPRRILENYYGGKEYFQAKATENAVYAFTPLAVDGEGFVLLDNLEYGEFEMVEEGQGFSYTVSFLTAPELELSSYDPVQIEVPSLEASEEEIAAEIEGLRQYYVDYEEVSDRPAETGDVVTVALIHDDEHHHDGGDDDQNEHHLDAEQPDESDELDATAEAHEHAQDIELGAGMMPEEFEQNIVGLAIGEVTEFEFNVAEQQESDAEPLKVKLRLDGIKKKILPELTDEWVKQTVEFESIDVLKQRIKESVEVNKAQELGSLRELSASKALAERLQGDVPEQLVKQTEQDNYKDFYNRLQSNRVSFDQYLEGNGLTPEAFREEMHEQGLLGAKISLALDALARQLGLSVSDDEVREEFEKAGVEDPEQLYQEWKQQGRLSEVRAGILRMKTSKHLVDTAEVFQPGSLPAEANKSAKVKKSKDDKSSSAKATAKNDAADKVADEKLEKPEKTSS